MMNISSAWLFVGLLLVSLPGYSKQLVLIQGYLSDASSWQTAGITSELSRHGWSYQGEFQYGSNGVRLDRKKTAPIDATPNVDAYFLVSLPTEAPIAKQAFYLTAYLKYLRKKSPNQALSLVGHSAGGIVARYVMVRNPELAIEQLITIASPHLGTDSAEFGKMAGDSPLALFAPLLGAGTLNRSQALYKDLLPEMPHRFLYWLNRQPHPEAEYISIVRDHQGPEGGDLIVPEQSQYLENVYDLRYRATSYIVPGIHGLNRGDGRLLLDLVREVKMPRVSAKEFPMPADNGRIVITT